MAPWTRITFDLGIPPRSMSSSPRMPVRIKLRSLIWGFPFRPGAGRRRAWYFYRAPFAADFSAIAVVRCVFRRESLTLENSCARKDLAAPRTDTYAALERCEIVEQAQWIPVSPTPRQC